MLVHPQGCREATSIVEDLGVVVHLSSIIKSVKDPVDGKIKKVKKLKDSESGYMVETDYKKGVSAGDYTYTVKAQDQHGNTAEKSYTIHVKARPVVQAPARSYSSYSGGSNSSSSYSAPEQAPSYSSDRIYVGGYSAYLSPEFDQYHTDLPDTAVYYYYNGLYLVGDHAIRGSTQSGGTIQAYSWAVQS